MAGKAHDVLPFPEALDVVRSHGVRLAVETCDLVEGFGRMLAKDVRAGARLPAFDNSQMDGFAVRAQDLRRARPTSRVLLAEIGRRYAGGSDGTRVTTGTTVRITTGAALPAGADAVVMKEDVISVDRGVIFRRPVSRGEYVRRAGADIQAGTRAVAAGTRIGASELALLASLNATEIGVRRRPRVAIVATGDELVPLGTANAGRLVDSNSVWLAARLRELGCDPVLRGIARDRESALRRKLARALDSDVVVTIAGASVGDRDLVKPVLTALGARFRFGRVAMRPGKPVGFAKLGKALVFTLPGNPVSARVTFEVLVVPALEALLGAAPQPAAWSATLAEAVSAPTGLTYFPRVRLERRRHETWARTVSKQNSGFLTSLTGADALAVIPESRTLKRGARVEVRPL